VKASCSAGTTVTWLRYGRFSGCIASLFNDFIVTASRKLGLKWRPERTETRLALTIQRHKPRLNYAVTQAERDIEEIGDFIARDNPRSAVTFITGLRDRCRHIAELPRAAPLRPGLGKGVRCIVFGGYLIFYIVHVRVLEVRRVLHGARNISADDIN
jgi:toxin ParE1/3/4